MTHEEFKQALESLQEGLYTKWEANLDSDFIREEVGIKSIADFLAGQRDYEDWLEYGFRWSTSPEGRQYWSLIQDREYLEYNPIKPQLTYWFVSFAHKQGFSSAHVSSESKYFDVKDMQTQLADMGYEATVLFYKEIPKEEYELNT